MAGQRTSDEQARETPQVVVWANGAFVAPQAGVVSALDDGLLTGRGAFETLRFAGGIPMFVSRHLERLHQSAAVVGIPVDEAAVRDGIAAVAAVWGPADGRARITVTAGGALLVSAAALPHIAPVARLVTAPWPRNERSPLAGAKTISYAENALAYDFAVAAGGTEALLCNTRGEISEGSRSNIFSLLDGELVTPPLTSGCLAGVTRALVIEYAGALEGTLMPHDLRDAPEAFVTSSLRGAQPIASVDGHELSPSGTAPAGPQTTRVQQIWRRLGPDA